MSLANANCSINCYDEHMPNAATIACLSRRKRAQFHSMFVAPQSDIASLESLRAFPSVRY
jgi:hypothetical protein